MALFIRSAMIVFKERFKVSKSKGVRSSKFRSYNRSPGSVASNISDSIISLCLSAAPLPLPPLKGYRKRPTCAQNFPRGYSSNLINVYHRSFDGHIHADLQSMPLLPSTLTLALAVISIFCPSKEITSRRTQLYIISGLQRNLPFESMVTPSSSMVITLPDLCVAVMPFSSHPTTVYLQEYQSDGFIFFLVPI